MTLNKLQAQLKYREKNREKLRLKNIEYRKKNKEFIARRGKEIRETNPVKHYTNVKTRRDRIRKELIDFLGGSCRNCGYENILALQVDHIFSDAKKDRQRFKNDLYVMYFYYLSHPKEAKERVQVLCANCNRLKVYSHNEMKRKYL